MRSITRIVLTSGIVLVAGQVFADEGGVSFWAPGQFASFAALPGEPGFAMPVVYYHVSADAGGEKNFLRGGVLTAGIDAKADLLFFFPTYTFKEPVWGAQASFGMGWAVAHMKASADIEITGPQGTTFGGRRTDTVTGGSDLYRLGELKWHDGNHNWSPTRCSVCRLARISSGASPISAPTTIRSMPSRQPSGKGQPS
jgi:hypothetical protein